MTRDEVDQALEAINDTLNIDARLTYHAELKCATPDDEGGTSKAYFDADDCRRLAKAFNALGAVLGTDEGRAIAATASGEE